MAEGFDGGCRCGAIRYRMSARPLFVHCCHCTNCQTESGSAFALNAMIEVAHVDLSAGKPVPISSESGRGQATWRCPDCWVAVWSNYAAAGNAINFVRVGSLDEPAAFPPDIHIFTRSRLPWVVLPPGTPAVEAYYDSAAVWPAASLARVKALHG